MKNEQATMDPTRPCTKCEGSGERPHWRDKGLMEPCIYCRGKGTFNAPDVKAIMTAIVCSRGKRKGKLLKSRPHPGKGDRAYFVWRLARFHGGADVCLPICAEMDIEGDPYKPELDFMAEKVAQLAFGTDMAAAHRWGRALGMVNAPTPSGLPMSAYEGGPPGTDIGGPEDSPEYHIDKHETETEGV